MKKYFLIGFALTVLLISISSCKKQATVAPTYPSSNLWALKAGNVWVYQDSEYNSNNTLRAAYPDTAIMTSATIQYADYPGLLFYGFKDSLGFLGPNTVYVSTPSDDYGGYILTMDDASSAPSIIYQTATSDNLVLASQQDNSTPTCVGTLNVYGYASSTLINGFTCTKNIKTYTDCNHNVIQSLITYVASGIGIVRWEYYKKDSNSTSNVLYLDFTQTLQKFLPK